MFDELEIINNHTLLPLVLSLLLLLLLLLLLSLSSLGYYDNIQTLMPLLITITQTEEHDHVRRAGDECSKFN